ncbi:MAG: hypothetical protein JJ916_01215 [Phycisphaerales bacterium]|nr:hypothetical protein [Phycisphaerales bacterium]
MKQEQHNHTPLNRVPSQVALYTAVILTSTTAMVLSGCIAAAAAAGAGAGYAVGHEQGEDHVTSGEHGDDD